MKEILLTQGKIAIVDKDDFEWLKERMWYAKKDKFGFWYAYDTKTKEKMHRVIMSTPPNLYVDHINHNTLDNRKNNLRNVTPSQNQMNTKISKRNKTGVKGVFKRGEKYTASINENITSHYLGICSTLTQAKEAYDKASEKYHKEFRNKG